MPSHVYESLATIYKTLDIDGITDFDSNTGNQPSELSGASSSAHGPRAQVDRGTFITFIEKYTNNMEKTLKILVADVSKVASGNTNDDIRSTLADRYNKLKEFIANKSLVLGMHNMPSDVTKMSIIDIERFFASLYSDYVQLGIKDENLRYQWAMMIGDVNTLVSKKIDALVNH